ncbi:MAG: Cna B-type domain-containing protein, partial [Firmicutes bacterium]|nr:Cna B-type domain-containing protein [Bacillota bacterium]
QDGKAYGDPVRLTEAEKWTYTWTNLPGNHTYTVAEPIVPENYVMGSQTTKDPGATVIKITVDITNTYVPSAAETFDNSKILIIVSCTMVLAVCFLALKMRKTASK